MNERKIKGNEFYIQTNKGGDENKETDYKSIIIKNNFTEIFCFYYFFYQNEINYLFKLYIIKNLKLINKNSLSFSLTNHKMFGLVEGVLISLGYHNNR